MNVLRTKSVEQSIAETDEAEHRLKKTLGTLDLIVFGVGVIIGAGIFVLTGTVAASNSGPAIALSFAIAGVACALAALCYAEFASTVPVAGSAYTFSYATFGELVAWIIGWDLVLEFTIGSAALSTSFSGYLQTLLVGTPLEIPTALASAEDGLINLPAVLVALAVMTVLILGIKFSSRLNQVVVAIKLAVVLFVIVAGLQYVKAENYSPFIPPAEPTPEAAGGFLDIPLISSVFGLEPSIYGLARRRRRRGGGLLRVHRLRHRRHHRRGDEEPAARRAARHPRLAGHRHPALHGGQPGGHRHAELPEIDPADAAPLSTAFDPSTVPTGWAT